MLVHPLLRRTGLLPVLVLMLLVLAPASVFGAGFERDQTPLPAKLTGGASGSGGAASHDPVSSGATIRMLVGLAIVLALIYGLYRLLKRTSGKGETAARGGDEWMSVIASTQLAPSRSVHLIRVGEEIVLVGSGDHGVTPIRVYSAEEARQLRIEPSEPLALSAGPSGTARPGFLTGLVDSLKRMTAR